MGALKSGAFPVELNGKEYGLLFSLNALDEVQEKFGGYDKLSEVFNKDNPNLFKDTRWLLTLLINEALLAEDENAQLLEEKRVGRLIHAGNLQEVQNAIFKSFYRGTAGDNSDTENENDGEETTEEGNRAAVPASHVIRHYDVTGKICPNPYVYNTSAHTWDEFKRKISGQAETPQGGNEKTIWNFLTGKGLNAYAVAGIMGNLYAESGLMPNNLQNTYNNKLGKTDAEYTAAVDNGSYGNFVKDSAGYGLAQWTYWSRKQALLNHAKQAGVSIADLNMQLGFLWEELQGYTAVMDALKKAGSVRAASDAVLTGYEKPADQSETVKKKRAEYGEGYYKKYAAGNGTKYYRVRKSWTDAASQLGAFTSLENAKSACKAGYTVYDDNGKAVYTAAGQQASAGVPFSVQVDILDLNIRTGAGTNYAKTGETTGKGVFTIVEVKAGQGASVGWGRLKSGAGWISLDYATRLA